MIDPLFDEVKFNILRSVSIGEIKKEDLKQKDSKTPFFYGGKKVCIQTFFDILTKKGLIKKFKLTEEGEKELLRLRANKSRFSL